MRWEEKNLLDKGGTYKVAVKRLKKYFLKVISNSQSLPHNVLTTGKALPFLAVGYMPL